MSWKKKPTKPPVSSKFHKDPEEEREFEELRRKYAYAIVYLLVKNIHQSELRDYLEHPDNIERFEGLKKFRNDILEKRPKARQWVDKAFYLGIKLGEASPDSGAALIVKDYMFNHKTSAVSTPYELDHYIDTIAKIIESEKIWSDPVMQAFDFGARADNCVHLKKKKNKKQPDGQDDDTEILPDVDTVNE